MIKKLVYILAFIAVPFLASGATYTVSQTGAGKDYSAATFNALSGDYSGDTFYFSGTFTTAISSGVYGTNGSPVIYDGYQTDDTTYADLSEASGRAKIDVTTAANAIAITGEDYITIRDFEITDCLSGIAFSGSSDGPTIERVFIYECVDDGIRLTDVVDGTVDDVVIKNVGTTTAAADITWTEVGRAPHDLIISNSHLYADNASWGIDGVTSNGGAYDVLIEYNSIHGHNHSTSQGENGIDLKEDCYNFIIRYNHIYNHDYAAEIELNGDGVLGSADQVYIYGNYIEGGESTAFNTKNSSGAQYDDIYIFSNVFEDMALRGIAVNDAGSFTIFNNTFAVLGDNPGNSSHTALYVAEGTVIFKNNIVYKSRPNESDYRQYYIGKFGDETTTSDYNRYFWPSQTSGFYWGNAGSNNLASLQSGSGQGLPQEENSTEGDPGLTDIANGDYTIGSGAAVIDGGVDMGSGAIATLTIQGVSYPVNWGVALTENTDWVGTIPVIETVNRDDEGWDQGAYSDYTLGQPIKGITVD